jgi:hypothetical protein
MEAEHSLHELGPREVDLQKTYVPQSRLHLNMTLCLFLFAIAGTSSPLRAQGMRGGAVRNGDAFFDLDFSDHAETRAEALSSRQALRPGRHVWA